MHPLSVSRVRWSTRCAPVLLAGVLCLGPAGRASAAPLQAADTAHCVDAHSLDLRRILPAPPADGSAEQQAELAELHRFQAQRTTPDIELARADQATVYWIFKSAFHSRRFMNSQLPLLNALFVHMSADEAAVLAPAQEAFARRRPFDVDLQLQPMIANVRNRSYPSAHALWGYVGALVLADMVPEKRDALLARAAQYAQGRLVAGVNYPSDIEAGRLAGTALAAMLFDCTAFATEEAAAKQELRKALALP